MAIWPAGPPKDRQPILSQTLNASPKLGSAAPPVVRGGGSGFGGHRAKLSSMILLHGEGDGAWARKPWKTGRPPKAPIRNKYRGFRRSTMPRSRGLLLLRRRR